MKKRLFENKFERYKESKKAQVTLFIILGIVIVGLGALVYMFYPQIKASFGFELKSPNAFLQECIEEDITNTIENISLQGGSLNPESYYNYNNQKLQYLCYTNEYYKTCTVQQPLLRNSIAAEIKEDIKEEISICFDELKRAYEEQGYSVVLRKGDFNIELLPKRIALNSETSMSIRKGETQTYDSFVISINNNLYELLGIVNSIIQFEAQLGDAEITNYMNYYRDLKAEKLKQTDGTTLYILTDTNTGNKFQFASRSVAWPPGYW